MSQASVNVGLGWLDGSAKSPVPDEVENVVRGRFGPPFDMPPVGFYLSRHGYDGGRVSVAWNGRQNALGTTRVEVTQTALDGLGMAGSVELLRDLTAAGYRPSRLDEWVNDPERRMTPGRVRAAVLGGQAVTHARPGRWVVDDVTQRETYYLGRPGSDRMVRCYDREDGQVRYELQSRRDAARHATTVLLASVDPVQALVANVVSFADYRESKARDRDGVRRPRLDWWAAVSGDTASATGAPSRPERSLDDLARQFEIQYSGRLALLYRELGPEWLNDVIRRGMHRLEDLEEVAS